MRNSLVFTNIQCYNVNNYTDNHEKVCRIIIHTYLFSHYYVWCLAQFLSSEDGLLYLLLASFYCWYNRFVAQVRQGFIHLSTQSCLHFQALYVFLNHTCLHCWETFADSLVVNRRNNCWVAFSVFLNALVHLIWPAMYHYA